MLISAKKENKTGKWDQEFWGRDFLLLSNMVLKGRASDNEGKAGR